MSTIKNKDFFINIPNGTLYVKKWIPENCEHCIPIILLHDSLGSVDLWKDFPEKLAKRLSRVVIAYDRLGFGGSSARDKIPSRNFIREEAEIYFSHLIDGLSLNKFLLFGHSVGGSMSIEIAAKFVACVAVITESSQAFIEELTLIGIRQAKLTFQNPERIEKLEKWHGQKAEWVLRAWVDVWLSPEFLDWSLEDCISKVKCPLLAIHGDNDEYGSKAFPEFISGKSGGESQMMILDGCGHVPHKEKQQEVLGCISSFINKYKII